MKTGRRVRGAMFMNLSSATRIINDISNELERNVASDNYWFKSLIFIPEKNGNRKGVRVFFFFWSKKKRKRKLDAKRWKWFRGMKLGRELITLLIVIN